MIRLTICLLFAVCTSAPAAAQLHLTAGAASRTQNTPHGARDGTALHAGGTAYFDRLVLRVKGDLFRARAPEDDPAFGKRDAAIAAEVAYTLRPRAPRLDAGVGARLGREPSMYGTVQLGTAPAHRSHFYAGLLAGAAITSLEIGFSLRLAR